MRHNPAIATLSSLLLAVAVGCGGGATLGTRSDGVTVECLEDTGDDVHVCDPLAPAPSEPPAEVPPACEDWQGGGPAIVLWPPNHKLHRFTLDDCAALPGECAGDATTATSAAGRIVAVTSDEPLEVGAGGDGHTPSGDLAIIDDRTVEVRSERQGGGDGRVYRVYFEDGAGGTGACEILVPHDRGPFEGAYDSGEQVRVER